MKWALARFYCTYKSFDDFSEDHMFSIHPSCLDHRNEELRTVCVFSTVGHRDHSSCTMTQHKFLVVKLFSKYARSYNNGNNVMVRCLCQSCCCRWYAMETSRMSTTTRPWGPESLYSITKEGHSKKRLKVTERFFSGRAIERVMTHLRFHLQRWCLPFGWRNPWLCGELECSYNAAFPKANVILKYIYLIIQCLTTFSFLYF